MDHGKSGDLPRDAGFWCVQVSKQVSKEEGIVHIVIGIGGMQEKAMDHAHGPL